MRIHLEVQSDGGDQGGWSAWVDIVHEDDRRECIWSRGGTKLRPLVQCGLERLIERADADEVDRLHRRIAELEQAAAERVLRDDTTRAAEWHGFDLAEHHFVDGQCDWCGAEEPVA